MKTAKKSSSSRCRNTQTTTGVFKQEVNIHTHSFHNRISCSACHVKKNRNVICVCNIMIWSTYLVHSVLLHTILPSKAFRIIYNDEKNVTHFSHKHVDENLKSSFCHQKVYCTPTSECKTELLLSVYMNSVEKLYIHQGLGCIFMVSSSPNIFVPTADERLTNGLILMLIT